MMAREQEEKRMTVRKYTWNERRFLVVRHKVDSHKRRRDRQRYPGPREQAKG